MVHDIEDEFMIDPMSFEKLFEDAKKTFVSWLYKVQKAFRIS